MKTTLLHVLMYALRLFEYDKETNPRLTIVSYPELERDYLDFLKEFEMRSSKEIEDTSISDELKEDLQNYCEEVDRARIFELIPPDEKESKLRKIRNFSGRPSGWNTRLKTHCLKINNTPIMVPMFPCFMGTNSDHFYITYGFNPGYMFVFKYSVDSDSGLKVYGLVEPTPVINQSFSSVRHLEKFFVQIHRTYESKSRHMDPICSLTGYQQFRLCSVLENARRYDAAENDIVTEDKKLNMEKRHQKRCEEKLKVTFAKLAKTNPAYSSLSLQITALPCHTDNHEFSFLVSQDPSDEHSVFILDWLVNSETKEKEARVMQHVRNIALLKYANDLY